MTTINPYLVFKGNCEEAFNFYKTVFGGDFKQIARFKDIPPMPGQELPESLKEKIMHVSLPISKETIIMGSDTNPMMGTVSTEQNLTLSVVVENKDEAGRIFNSL